MKKLFSGVLAAGLFLLAACNAKNTATAEKSSPSDPAVQQTIETAPPTEPEKKAVEELCTCLNSFMAQMNPRVKKIIIDAGKTSDPVRTLTSELGQLGNSEEEQRILREFELFQSSDQLQQCTEDIRKKYRLDENNKASRDRMMAEAEASENCELMYALMKIGMAQQAAQTPTAPTQR